VSSLLAGIQQPNWRRYTTWIIHRTAAFILTVLARLKHLTCFLGSVVFHTLEHSWKDQIKCIVSQLVEAYSLRETPCR
jgi:hypothetical protein